VWSIDGTQVGRKETVPVRAEVVRDVGAKRTLDIGVGHSITGKSVVELLEHAAQRQTWFPLVIASDNGGENRNADVDNLLDHHRIIALHSLPRTPQHNAWSERGIRELKADAELESSTPVTGVAEVAVRLAGSWRRLDTERGRPPRTRSPSTSTVDNPGTARYTPEYRERFYDATRAAIARAVVGCERKREQRRGTREAILATLEQFGEITRTWGSGASARVKRERIA
jgi:transposase InsO family protein